MKRLVVIGLVLYFVFSDSSILSNLGGNSASSSSSGGGLFGSNIPQPPALPE